MPPSFEGMQGGKKKRKRVKKKMNTKEKIINQYKINSDLLVKRNLLKLLNTKYLNLGLTDADYITENILTNILASEGGRLTSNLKMRYGRNYNNIIFELV